MAMPANKNNKFYSKKASICYKITFIYCRNILLITFLLFMFKQFILYLILWSFISILLILSSCCLTLNLRWMIVGCFVRQCSLGSSLCYQKMRCVAVYQNQSFCASNMGSSFREMFGSWRGARYCPGLQLILEYCCLKILLQ